VDEWEFQVKESGEQFTHRDYTPRHAEVFAARYDDGLGDCKLATFRRLVGDIAGRRVLDLGCGEGTFSRACLQAGASPVATDFAASMVAATAARSHGSFPIVRASATAIPQRSESVDIVLALDIIEHLYEPAAALDEIHRVLGPGGRLMIATDRDGFNFGAVPFRVRRLAVAGRDRLPPRLATKLHRRRGASPVKLDGTAADHDRYHTPLCTHTHEFELKDLLDLVSDHGFRFEALDTYPHRARLDRYGQFVEAAARGPLRRYKWNYVMVRFVKTPA
jgi:SAM-dependent methyltransferase